MRDDGGSAFPIGGYDGVEFTTREPGMSLRDWFAGQALAGIEAAETAENGFGPDSHLVARRAYARADAMLAERAKP